MGLFDFFKGKKKDDASQKSIARNVLNLQVNDIVTYDLEDYIVIGEIVYTDSGYEWTAYHLKGDTLSIWLSAEMDDELEIGIYKKIPTKVPSNVPEELEVDGVSYNLEEHGYAMIKEVKGQAGAVEGQQVEYWEFESDDANYLSIEKWGGDLEVSKGYSITEKELQIIAGS